MARKTEIIKTAQSLVERRLPGFADKFRLEVIPSDNGKNTFEVEAADGFVNLRGDCAGSIGMALGWYLKEICDVNWSWNGNRELKLSETRLDFEKVRQVVPQKYRVYMNYCTLAYSMCWWGWERWEKELDFMALNGMNMPLCVIGTEAVWFETLRELGFSEKESLSTISSPAFWPWQLMTNIEGYQPIHTLDSVYDRLELGKKILNRALELGMQPIQQGFSGHVPVKLMEKFPSARIQLKPAWCKFPKTAQLDPLDPLFARFGRIYLEKQGALMGNYHYYACDPFHEGAPPRKGIFYLRKVGRAIDKLYQDYDKGSVWVMQSWSLRKHIAIVVPKERLLILDLDGAKCQKTRHFWGREYVSCHLHNFGGKNSLHGRLEEVASNRYAALKAQGGNVVGAGIMMEGIEQNPVYYDLLFDVDVSEKPVDLNAWLKQYAVRRYGKQDNNAEEAWRLLLQSCYSGMEKYEEESGSVVCCRPRLDTGRAAPNDTIGLRYDNRILVSAIRNLLKSRDALGVSDGYQFDVCDFTRQALSNLVVENQPKIKAAYKAGDAAQVRALAEQQLAIMADMDCLLAHRSELNLDKWLYDAGQLAKTPEEEKLFQKSAKMLLTLWGDADGDDPSLYDYAWREWAGLIKGFYIPRWQRFYEALLATMENGQPWDDGKNAFFGRPVACDTSFGRQLLRWEKDWVNTYVPVETEPEDMDVIPFAEELMERYFAPKE